VAREFDVDPSGVVTVRAGSGARERLFPIWLLVNAIVSTLLAASMVVTAVATVLQSREGDGVAGIVALGMAAFLLIGPV
jgi:hypothetical protein